MLSSEGTTFFLSVVSVTHHLFHVVHHAEGHFINLMAYTVEFRVSFSRDGYIELWLMSL